MVFRHAQAPSRSVSVSSDLSVDAQLAKGIKPAQPAIAVGNKGFVPDEVSYRAVLGSSPGLWAATAASYCRAGELPKTFPKNLST